MTWPRSARTWRSWPRSRRWARSTSPKSNTNSWSVSRRSESSGFKKRSSSTKLISCLRCIPRCATTRIYKTSSSTWRTSRICLLTKTIQKSYSRELIGISSKISQSCWLSQTTRAPLRIIKKFKTSILSSKTTFWNKYRTAVRTVIRVPGTETKGIRTKGTTRTQREDWTPRIGAPSCSSKLYNRASKPVKARRASLTLPRHLIV